MTLKYLNRGNMNQGYVILILIIISCGQREVTSPTANPTVSEPGDPYFSDDDSLAESSVYVPPEIVRSDLSFIKDLEGQYIHDIDLLDHEIFKQRLIELVGPKYEFVKDVWIVSSPIQLNNKVAYIWGMQAHSGGDPSAVVMVDFEKNVVYVGLRDDDKEIFYSEDGSSLPKRLIEWAGN